VFSKRTQRKINSDHDQELHCMGARSDPKSLCPHKPIPTAPISQELDGSPRKNGRGEVFGYNNPQKISYTINYVSASMLSNSLVYPIKINCDWYFTFNPTYCLIPIYSYRICPLRARLAQLQLLILSEDLKEPCQTGIFKNWFSCGAERSGVVFVKKGEI
jgi:hypothetical protein